MTSPVTTRSRPQPGASLRTVDLWMMGGSFLATNICTMVGAYPGSAVGGAVFGIARGRYAEQWAPNPLDLDAEARG